MQPKFIAILFAVACFAAVSAGAQSTTGALQGTVTDASGAVLPGVTVTASPEKRGEVITIVTDGQGQYEFSTLQPGPYVVRFELEGFQSLNEPSIVLHAGETSTIDQVLELGSLHESVTVTAAAPSEPPVVVVMRDEPLPDLQPVPHHAPFSVCGPRRPDDTETAIARVASQHQDSKRFLLGNRDILVLDAGLNQGLQAGQNFVVRRKFHSGATYQSRVMLEDAEHTAALIQLATVDADSSKARVVYLCDEIAVGDLVVPFEPAIAETSGRAGKPDFDRPARILFADERRTLGAPGALMVIDTGRNQGAQVGQWLTMFRGPQDARVIDVVGVGQVVALQADTATIRVQSVRDIIEVGDAVALHR